MGNIVGDVPPTSLFSNYSTIMIDAVQRSNEFYPQFSVDGGSIGENICSQLLIANLYEDKLKEILKRK